MTDEDGTNEGGARQVGIRAATAGDADAMGALHVRAWQHAYRGVMPDEYLDGLEPAERAEMWRTRIARAELTPVLVATVDDVLAGFGAYGRPLDLIGAEPDDCGQLYAINLDPAFWGIGVGRALLRRATEAIRELGCSQAVLWVVPQNARARRLYESEGWHADGGETSEEMLGVQVVELRYRRSLDG